MARRVPQKHGGVLTVAEKGDVFNKTGRGGRPRLTTTISKELAKQGVEPVGRQEIIDIIARLQNLPRKKLLEFLEEDADTPVVVALIVRGMLAKDGPDFLIRTLMDRQFGRPSQETTVNLKEPIPVPVIVMRPDTDGTEP